MLSHEDLWIKISNDFHAEINPILEQINTESKQSCWFDRKSILGKFFIIKNLLLEDDGKEFKHYPFTRLINILEAFKIRVKEYFNFSNIATCFIYYYPENQIRTIELFKSIQDYFSTGHHSGNIGHSFMVDGEIIGFPNDCSYKLTAKLVNNEIEIRQNNDPLFPIELEKGKLIGNPKRTRKEQDEVDYHIYLQEPELENLEKYELQKFKDFAKETQLKKIALIENFDQSINLCKSIIEKKQKDTTPANLPEIERIYSVLINGYIQEPFERFQSIFQSNYSGEKLIWLKTGTELKYFVDRINDKFDLSNEINKWTGARFQLTKPVKNMTGYLSKQTSKDEYQLLIQGNLKKNLIYKLFKE